MAKQHTPAFLALVRDSKQRVRETTIPELKKRLDAKEGFHLIDVREDHEWAAGHIPGAKHLSRGIIERDIESQIPDREAEILLYCGGGYRSALVADNLQKMGYKNVVSVDGGWRGWVGSGFPVEKEGG
jgi:rhodanese-related sulfurtransferase